MTVEKLTQWILDNRKGDAFIGWTKQQVFAALLIAMAHNTLTYSHDGERFNGVILAKETDDVLHIYGAIATEPSVLRKMAKWLLNNHSGKQITALRKGQLTTYNLNTVLRILK